MNTLAFFANTDTSKAAKKEISIWHSDILSGAIKVVADNKLEGLKKGWIVSENSHLSFSENGKRLF